MRRSTFYRGGAAAAFVAGVGAAIFGLTTTAHASSSLYESTDANVKVTGGEAIAFNQCINDAKDGVIQNQQNACDQVAQSGNILTFDNVGIYVQRTTFPFALLYRGTGIRVELTGGVASAANLCLNDAEDGVIQNQQNMCTQVSTAGNLMSMTNVGVTVYARS